MVRFRGVFRCACVPLLMCCTIASSGFGQVQRHRRPFVSDQYIVFLADPPVSARYPSRALLRSAAAAGYRQQVMAAQRSLEQSLAARGFAVAGAVSTVLNAVFVAAPASRLDELRAMPGVLGVRRVRRGRRNLNAAVPLAGGAAAWAAVGGQQNAGKGVMIAVLDSGIDQNHPAFQDSSLSVPSGFPKCNTVTDCLNFTNNKVIVARSYVPQMAAGSDPSNPAADSRPDDLSARDHIGHGTAVASAAAGNLNTGALTFTGMAPKAYLGSYKIYGSPGVNDYPPETVWEQAIEDVVNDSKDLNGMVVVAFSSGLPALTGPLDSGADCGLSGTAPCDPLAAAFENAARAGLVIAASAGNGGGDSVLYNFPNLSSVESPAAAPSVLAVGAILNSHVLVPTVSLVSANAPATLKNLPAQLGDSSSALFAGGGPLVTIARIADAGTGCNALPAASLAGAIALIKQGDCTLGVKATNAQNAGAIGVVFYMADASSPIAPEGVDAFTGPVVMLSQSDGASIRDYINSNANQSAMIDLAGREQTLTAYSSQFQISPALTTNQLATYSSSGPALGTHAIKPDLLAPGGLDVFLAPDPNNYYLPPPPGMYLATESFDPRGDLYSPTGYSAADGTSFSAPLVAGAAALVRQKFPSYTAAQVRSALVNTAVPDVKTDDYGETVGIVSTGAGRMDAGAAMAATVTAEPASASFGALQAGATLPKSIAIALVNHGSSAVTLAASVVPVSSASGTTIALDSQSVTIPGGGAGSLNVTLSGSVPPAGSYSGFIGLQGSGVSLRIPYLFLVGSGTADNIPTILGNADGIAGQDLGYWAIPITDAYGVAVANASVGFTVTPRGAVTFSSVPGEPACGPATSSSSVVCPTDKYGYAWVDVVLGPNPGTPTITVGAAGARTPFSVTSRAQPTIATGGVLPAANVDAGTPIAPGSYVAIYGTGLADSVGSNPYTRLPLSLNNVTVSFDVPSANLSLPGTLIYVSPNQVNVQAPWELQGHNSAQVKVTINQFSFGNVVSVPVSDYSPAFFHTVADALDTGYAVISATHPARRGQTIQLFVNGLGPVTSQPASGAPANASSLSMTTSTPVVNIGGQQATVGFSGLAPGFAGLYQVNVTVPSGIAAGAAVPITIAIGGQTSKAATIPVE